MGWISFYHDGRKTADLIRQYVFPEVDKDKYSQRILDLAIKGPAAYVALEIIRLPTVEEPTPTRCVVGYVVAFSRKDGQFCYKDMEETCGPCDRDCPERILKKLSPLEDLFGELSGSSNYAAQWRADCWETVNKRKNSPPVGTTIRFPAKIKFNYGLEEDTFVVEARGVGKGLRMVTNGSPCRLSHWQQREYEIITVKSPLAVSLSLSRPRRALLKKELELDAGGS